MDRRMRFVLWVALSAGLASAQKSPLEAWLWNLTVAIPDVSGSVGGFEISLKDTVCTHFAVQEIRGKSSERIEEYSANLTVEIQGVKASCAGNWKYEAENGIHWPKSSGSLSAASKNSSIAANLGIIGTNGWPEKATLLSCSTNIDLDVSFDGDSISAKILELLQDFISEQIQLALNAELCDDVLEPLVSTNLTHALNKLEDGLSLCSANCKAEDSKRMTQVATLWNQYPYGEFIDWSRLLDAPTISTLLTCGIESLTPLQLTQLDLSLTAPIPGYGNITFTLDQLNATLPESLKAQLSGMNATIDAALAAHGWTNLSLGLAVAVNTLTSKQFTERFTVSLAALDTSFRAGLAAVVRPAMLGADYLGQLASSPLGCAVEATDLFNLTSLQSTAAHYSMKVTAPIDDTSLESGLDQVASQALELMLSTFPALVDAGLRCLLDGAAVPVINRLLSQALGSAGECLNTAPVEGLVYWNESAVLALLDSVVTAKTADWALDCLSSNDDHAYFSELHLLEGVSATTIASTAVMPTPHISLKVHNTLASLVLDNFSWQLQFELPLDAYSWYQNTTLAEALNSLSRFNSETQGAMNSMATALGSGKYFFNELQNNCGPLERALVSPPIVDTFGFNASSFAWNVTGWRGEDNAAMAALLDEAIIAITELAAEYGEAALQQINEGLRKTFDDTKKLCSDDSTSSSKKSSGTIISSKQLLLVIAVTVIVLTSLLLVLIFGKALQRGTKLISQDESLNDSQENTLDSPLLQSEHVEPDLTALELRCAQSSLFGSPHLPGWLRCGVPLLLCANVALFVWSNSTSAASVDVELTLLEHASGVGPLTYHLGSLFKFSLSNSVRDMWKAGVYPLSVIIALCSGGWPYAKLVAMLVCWLAPPLPAREAANDDDSCGCALLPRSPYFGLDAETREATLIWLDALGKWSLVDSYVMTLMIVAFHFDVTVGMDEGGGDFRDAVIVHVYVEALTSMYVFVGATCLSLGLGHVVLACHRSDAKSREDNRFLLGITKAKRGFPCETEADNDELSVDEEPLARCSLSDHTFNAGALPVLCVAKSSSKLNRDVAITDDDNDGDLEERQHSLSIVSTLQEQPQSSSLGFWTRFAVVLGLLTTIVFVIAGALTDAFDFDIRGLAGWIMGDEAKKTLSMVSLGLRVPKSSRHPHSAGALALAGIYLAYALIFPLLLLPALIFLWLVPLRLAAQTALFRVCEVLNAWAALDVFMIAILAAITEISQFAAFMVGDKCDSLNKVLKKHLNKQLHGDDVCFTVVTQLKRGIWFLLAAALLSGFIAHLVLRCCHIAIQERDRRRRRYDFRREGNQSLSRVADNPSEFIDTCAGPSSLGE